MYLLRTILFSIKRSRLSGPRTLQNDATLSLVGWPTVVDVILMKRSPLSYNKAEKTSFVMEIPRSNLHRDLCDLHVCVLTPVFLFGKRLFFFPLLFYSFFF